MNLGISNNYQCSTNFGCKLSTNTCTKEFIPTATKITKKGDESNFQILKHVLNGIWTNAKIDANNFKNFITGKIN